jgi:hypothetical protein
MSLSKGGNNSGNGGNKGNSTPQRPQPQPVRESVIGGTRPNDGLRKSNNVSLSVPVPPKKIGK